MMLTQRHDTISFTFYQTFVNTFTKIAVYSFMMLTQVDLGMMPINPQSDEADDPDE